MATDVHIGGQTYKKRNVFAVWIGLPFITFGVYHLVWWYKVNNEARGYLGDTSINPVLSVLALVPGVILIVPPLVSVYRTAGRDASVGPAGAAPTAQAGQPPHQP